MLRLFFLIVLFWMSQIRVMAQNPTVSELRANFEQAEPAKKLAAVVELLNEYFYSGNLRDGVDFGEKFLLTLDTTQTSQPLAQIHNRLGTLYTSLGDHEYLAVFHLNRSLEVSRNLNWLLGISTALNNLGNIYRDMGYYARAHEFYTQSIEVCERDEDSLGLSYAYKNLGLLAEDQGWKHKAFDYHLKAYQIRKLLGRKREILSSLLSLGIVLNADQKYDSALIFLESAEGLARVLNSEMQSEVALEQGEAYAHLNQMDIALNKYDEALMKAVTYKKSRAIANILIHKIDMLLVNHMLEQSEANLAILKKHLDTTRYVTGKINFYDLSYQLDSIRGNEISALRNFYQMELLSDSIDRLADHEQLMIKQNMFELMQKDAIINLEKEKREFQRILFFSIIAFLALLSLGFIIAFRQKYKDAQVLREKQNQILERNQALKEKNEELTILLQKLKAADEQIQLQHQQIIKHNEQLIEMVNVRTNEIGERATQITQFAFLVSHNMRGPVARILGLKNLIKLNPSREELDQILDRMGNSISEIEEIFSEIHELFDTRSNTGTRLELLDTKQLLNEIVEVMQEEIKMAKATVTLQLDRLPFFFSSLHDMKLIFTQLIINSLKFRSIERPCTITLEADIRNSNYYFSITDNGMGVDLSKHQNELFIPYKRFHRHVPGRGFNLFLIKNRIENLGGTIMMESKVNSFTKVTFILPRNSQS